MCPELSKSNQRRLASHRLHGSPSAAFIKGETTGSENRSIPVGNRGGGKGLMIKDHGRDVGGGVMELFSSGGGGDFVLSLSKFYCV